MPTISLLPGLGKGCAADVGKRDIQRQATSSFAIAGEGLLLSRHRWPNQKLNRFLPFVATRDNGEGTVMPRTDRHRPKRCRRPPLPSSLGGVAVAWLEFRYHRHRRPPLPSSPTGVAVAWLELYSPANLSTGRRWLAGNFVLWFLISHQTNP